MIPAPQPKYEYQVGGSLPADAPTYQEAVLNLMKLQHYLRFKIHTSNEEQS
jgi:hypothetical protein